jgi:hypothetical protein
MPQMRERRRGWGGAAAAAGACSTWWTTLWTAGVHFACRVATRLGAAGWRWLVGRRAIAGSALADPSVERRAFELDLDWFEQHPGRRYHLRRPVPGEMVDSCLLPGFEPHVLVKQIIPGFWIRTSCLLPQRLCCCERCLGKLWERLAPPEIQWLAVEMAARPANPDAAYRPNKPAT